MDFEILSADGEDAARWTALIHRLPPALRDIHFLPEYGRIYRDSHGFEPLLAVYRSGKEFVLQPFVRRPLRDLPFLAGMPDRGQFFDIANPYGFGGPLCSATNTAAAHDLYARFAAAFGAWCCNGRIASEFACLHPLMQGHQEATIRGILTPQLEKNVVIIDLRPSEEEILRRVRKGHRSSIALAQRRGIRVVKVAPNNENLAVFHEIYSATMMRRRAAPRWLLPLEYFNATIRELGEERTSLCVAYVGSEVESACMLIHDFATAYYHFAGTRAEHADSGVNNLLVWHSAMSVKKAGYQRLHLGGGVTRSPDDTLLRFKSGFSKDGVPLYSYFTVRHAAAYNQLCERKRAFERATAGAESESDFMPLYRR